MTTEQRDVIRKYYAETSNAELADMVGLSPRYVKRYANKCGLAKSERYLRQIKWENIMIARAHQRRAGLCGGDYVRKYHRVYEDVEEIAARWKGGEGSDVIASEYGIPRQQLITVLNRKGYRKNGNQ